MDGELAFEPNEAYEGEALPTMSLTAVFSGGAPAPPQTGAESIASFGFLLLTMGIGAVFTAIRRKES